MPGVPGKKGPRVNTKKNLLTALYIELIVNLNLVKDLAKFTNQYHSI